MASLRVLVRQNKTAHPLAGAQITVRLRRDNDQVTLYRGETGGQSTVEARFHIPNYTPDALSAELNVETDSPQGQQTRFVQPSEIRRAFRVLRTSDKPLYRPGQTLHMRVLALEAQTGIPAEWREITFVIESLQGQKLRRPYRCAGQCHIQL